MKHDEEFQIWLYRGSDKFTGGGDASYYFSKKNAGQIVANIWNWDPAWTVNVYENGAKTGTMTQYSDKDAWTVAYHIGILNNSSSYNKSTDHMFYYTLTNPAADVRSRRSTASATNTNRRSSPTPIRIPAYIIWIIKNRLRTEPI